MMKIALISLFDTNLGEELIKDCAKYLIERAAKENGLEIEVTVQNLFPREERFPSFARFRRNLERSRILLAKKFFPALEPFLCFVEELIGILKWHFEQKNNPEIKNYYTNIAKSSDIVVTAGGGFLSHLNLNLWAPFYALLCACEEQNTPVYVNCIGIERPSGAFSLLFKNILNKKCIKHMTVRDDIKTALKYCKTRQKCALAGDSALWVSECYGIQKADSSIIGVNVIRSGIFQFNGGKLSPFAVKKAYIGVINRLLERGYQIELFTNGLAADKEFAKELLDESNLNGNPKYLAPCPKTGENLAKRISTYKAVIGARMHCAIGAAALDIPFVEVFWKEKQRYFAKLLEREGWFFSQEEFLDSDYVIDLIEKAMEQGYNREVISRLKKLAYENLITHLF